MLNEGLVSHGASYIGCEWVLRNAAIELAMNAAAYANAAKESKEEPGEEEPLRQKLRSTAELKEKEKRDFTR